MVAEGGAWRAAGHIMPLAALSAMLFLHFYTGKLSRFDTFYTENRLNNCIFNTVMLYFGYIKCI